jgi:myo-inositol-hexaphosphate 3-phosphohydrolase
MVVQDGFNLMPQEPQNFKYISWRDVVETLKLD